MRPFVACLGACLTLLAACGEDEDVPGATSHPSASVSAMAGSPSPSTPIPNLTETAPATSEFEDFRRFAVEVATALDDRNTEFFLSDPIFSSMECPNIFTDCGVPYPTVIQGIAVGLWRSEGAVYSLEESRLMLRSYLEQDPKVHAVAALYHDIGGGIGGPAFYVIVTTPQAPETTAKALQFVNDNGRWRFRLYLDTGSSQSESEWLSGNCSECYDYWESWLGAIQ